MQKQLKHVSVANEEKLGHVCGAKIVIFFAPKQVLKNEVFTKVAPGFALENIFFAGRKGEGVRIESGNKRDKEGNQLRTVKGMPN